MEYMLYQSWLSHEQRNGAQHGRSDALYGKPMAADDQHVRFMPNNIQDKMAPQSLGKACRDPHSSVPDGL